MKKIDLRTFAKKECKKAGFKISKKIYQGEYYSKDNIRNIIYSGIYKNKPAVIKIYDDPRITDEPISLNNFHKNNKSKLIIAPKLYNYKIFTPNKGWLIIEKLPNNGNFYNSPLKPSQRSEFLKLYLEYRENFPNKPTRKLTLAENLNSAQFHVFRINRWFELANNKELERTTKKQKVILDNNFIKLYNFAINLITKEFKFRKMVWCHGHFKPKEIFKSPDQNFYYLTDFAHTHLYPQGYELAFIIWADWFMTASWKTKYSEWKKGVDAWYNECIKILKTQKIKNPNNLMKASLAERIIGSILADITASDRPIREQTERIKKLSKLFYDLI